MVRGWRILLALALLGVAAGVALVWSRPGSVTTHPEPTPTRSSPTVSPSQTASPTTHPPAPVIVDGPTLTPCPRVGVPTRLRVMTFNIHAGFGHGRYDLDGVADEVEAWGADVVLLQEVDRHRRRSGFRDQPSLLADRLGMDVAFGPNRVRPALQSGRPRQEYGTAILSTYPIVGSRNNWLPNRSGHERRGLLRATLDVDGQRVDVYNTHLAHDSRRLRLAQSRAIAELLRHRTLPAVLGGDLNAAPDTPVHGNLVEQRLVDAWDEARDGLGWTAPTFRPRHRIDVLMHDADWTSRWGRTHRSEVSDHLAVQVGLTLAAPRRCDPA